MNQEEYNKLTATLAENTQAKRPLSLAERVTALEAAVAEIKTILAQRKPVTPTNKISK